MQRTAPMGLRLNWIVSTLDWLESFDENESVPVSASGYVQF